MTVQPFVVTPAPSRHGHGGSVRGALVAAGAAVAATAVVAVWDPHRAGSYGFCPLYWATGLYCPACGALRATHELTRLDVAAAWSENALWVAALPLVVAAWVVVLVRRLRGRPDPKVATWVGWVGLLAMAVFGVLRNLPVPALAWMAP
jgi:hypothetical protein